MALYDVKCDACGHAAEVQASMKDGPPKKCPECGKNKLRPIISPPSVHIHYSPMHPRANRGRGR
jgi:putative FmdB family regulatory protein